MIKKCPGIKSLIFYISSRDAQGGLGELTTGSTTNARPVMAKVIAVQWSERATEVME